MTLFQLRVTPEKKAKTLSSEYSHPVLYSPIADVNSLPSDPAPEVIFPPERNEAEAAVEGYRDHESRSPTPAKSRKKSNPKNGNPSPSVSLSPSGKKKKESAKKKSRSSDVSPNNQAASSPSSVQKPHRNYSLVWSNLDDDDHFFVMVLPALRVLIFIFITYRQLS